MNFLSKKHKKTFFVCKNNSFFPQGEKRRSRKRFSPARKSFSAEKAHDFQNQK